MRKLKPIVVNFLGRRQDRNFTSHQSVVLRPQKCVLSKKIKLIDREYEDSPNVSQFNSMLMGGAGTSEGASPHQEKSR